MSEETTFAQTFFACSVAGYFGPRFFDPFGLPRLAGSGLFEASAMAVFLFLGSFAIFFFFGSAGFFFLGCADFFSLGATGFLTFSGELDFFFFAVFLTAAVLFWGGADFFFMSVFFVFFFMQILGRWSRGVESNSLISKDLYCHKRRSEAVAEKVYLSERQIPERIVVLRPTCAKIFAVEFVRAARALRIFFVSLLIRRGEAGLDSAVSKLRAKLIDKWRSHG